MVPAAGAFVSTALIIGGGGFFGEQLAGRLRASGWTVGILDRIAAPAWATAQGTTFCRGDTCHPKDVAASIAGADLVVHAAFAPPERDLVTIRRVNVTGTRNVLEACLDHGVGRFILLSSTIVDRPLWPHPVLPNAPLSRLAAYRDTRVQAEADAKRAADRGLCLAVVRPKTFLGPGGIGAFALLFAAIRQGRPVPVLGGGANRYQLLDVRDLTGALALLAGSPATGVFSLGAAQFGTVAEDLRSVVDHAGTGARLRLIPAPLAQAGLRALELAGWPPLSEWHQLSARGKDSVVDTSRAGVELGWMPAHSNAAALADAYDWYASTAGRALPTHPPPTLHRVLQRAASFRLTSPTPVQEARHLEERGYRRQRPADERHHPGPVVDGLGPPPGHGGIQGRRRQRPGRHNQVPS